MQKRLAIIIGHTSEEKGSRGVRPLDLHEYDFNKEVAMDLWRECREYGIDCQIFKRDEQTWSELISLVNNYSGNLGVCIELHCNSFNGKTEGTETLYNGDPSLAKHVQDQVCLALGRKAKQNKGIRLVHEVDAKHLELSDRVPLTVPYCIAMPIFWDNHKESGLMWRDRSKYVRALVLAVIAYYNEQKEG
jgi:N-acetylmuramoyl-L-alanine amidase